MPVQVVYFANLFVNPSRGHKLVLAQLHDLVATGLVEHALLTHVVISIPPRRNTHYILAKIANVFGVFYPTKVRAHFNHDDCHEFPGVSLAHSLARQSPLPDHYVLYFHAKGITRFRGRREPVELALHAKVIAPWREVLRILDTNPDVDKVGSSFSSAGWVWWNYWWSRASHLARVETPVLTPRRHYYEDWLARESQDQEGVATTERALTPENYVFSPDRCHGLNHAAPCDPATAVAVLMAA